VRLRVRVLFVIILHIGGGFLFFFFCGEGGLIINTWSFDGLKELADDEFNHGNNMKPRAMAGASL
jgi:hypothetical protein